MASAGRELLLMVEWFEPAYGKSRRDGRLAKWEDCTMVNMPYLQKASTRDIVPASNVEAVCFVGKQLLLVR